MEKDISVVLNSVRIPDFNKNDSTEQIILKFIEYVKDIERERGLSDEQIIAKYTYGCCANLANGIKYILKEKGIRCDYRTIDCNIPYNECFGNKGPHCLIEIYNTDNLSDTEALLSYTSSRLFFDINGKHDTQSIEEFANKFYIEDKKYCKIIKEMNDYEKDDSIPAFAADRVVSMELEDTKIPENAELFNDLSQEDLKNILHHGKITEIEILELENEKLTNEQLLSRIDEIISHVFEEFENNNSNQDVQSRVEQFERNLTLLTKKILYRVNFDNQGIRSNTLFKQKLKEIQEYIPKASCEIESKTFQEQMRYFNERDKEIKVKDLLRRSQKNEISFRDMNLLSKILMNPQNTQGVISCKNFSNPSKTLEELKRFGFTAKFLENGELEYKKDMQLYPQKIGGFQTELSTKQKTENDRIVKYDISKYKEEKREK